MNENTGKAIRIISYCAIFMVLLILLFLPNVKDSKVVNRVLSFNDLIYLLLFLVNLTYVLLVKEVNPGNLKHMQLSIGISFFSLQACLYESVTLFLPAVLSVPVIYAIFILPFIMLLMVLRLKFGKEGFRLLAFGKTGDGAK